MFLYQLFTSFEMPLALFVFLAYFLALLIALSAHEFAHGFAAYREGDMTAKAYGRLTLNPFKHVDIMGMIFLILVGFGWSKPVPINPTVFKNGKRSAINVCLSGVLTNLALAIIFSFLFVLTSMLDPSVSFFVFLHQFCYYSVMINFVFFVFNLLPIYPLDGFNFLCLFLKPTNKFLEFMFKYGFIVLLLLYITNIFGLILNLLMSLIINPLTQLWILILF